MQKPVGLDREGDPRAVSPRRPLGERHPAAVVGLHLPGCGETTEVVLADERGRGLRQCRRIEPATQRPFVGRSEEHTSELQSQSNLVCRLLLEKKKKMTYTLDCS